MNKFTQVVKEFWEDEEGLTLLEYILGAALIVAAFVVAGDTFWDTLKGTFDDVGDCIDDPSSDNAAC
ncbi:hypothetical protein QTO01_06105 [Vibrio mytili]|uniref:Flp family type IVb pilin n=1 Tax=Vibrio mytili TaxID=50718 RepID=UPI002F4103D8